MAEQFYTIPTAIGKAKIANSIALGTKINLTTMKIGDSNGSYYNPNESQTDLVHSVYSCNINSVAVDEDNANWINIICALPSDVGDFYMREAGAFDDTGALIAIGKYPETYKPIATNGSTKEIYIKMTLEVTSTSSIELKIDPTVVLATKKDIDILTNSINSITTQLSERVKKSTVNINYYVDATNGNDINDGLTSGTAFKTINKALSLIPQVINHNVTINLANGFYNETLNLNFIGSGNFTILGDSTSSINCRVTSLNANHCTCYISIRGLYIPNNAITVFGCTDISFNYMFLNNAGDFGFKIGGSNCTIANSQIWNKTNSALIAYHSLVYSNNNTGSENNVGLQALEGSTIAKNGTQPSATTSEVTGTGGVIR